MQTNPIHLDPADFDPASLDSTELDASAFDSAELGSAGLDAAAFGPTELGSAGLGTADFGPTELGSSDFDPVRIEPMRPAHARQVLAIYQAGIDEGNATFEVSAPGWEEFSAARLPDHRYVAVSGSGVVLGWVAVSAVSGRCVYAGVVEHSVYVRPDARGRGIGGQLLAALISSTEATGIWTIQSGIFPENKASAALHLAAGFRVVGTRERLGRHHGRWRDILLLERRSPAI
ncbi:MAG TPA: GNAT family N-acetyltransferase [Streptosporangiaceae bacterium]|nr:GNAT family N-acetyltransferase [Streptosporangiaceae bacterium]